MWVAKNFNVYQAGVDHNEIAVVYVNTMHFANIPQPKSYHNHARQPLEPIRV